MDTISCLSLIVAPIIVGVTLLFIEYRIGWFAKRVENYRDQISPKPRNTSSHAANSRASPNYQQPAQGSRQPPSIQQKNVPSRKYSQTMNPNWVPGFLDRVRQDMSRRLGIKPSEIEVHGWASQGITHFDLLLKTSVPVEVEVETPDILETMVESILGVLPPLYQDYFSDVFKPNTPEERRKIHAKTFKVITESNGEIISVHVIRQV